MGLKVYRRVRWRALRFFPGGSLCFGRTAHERLQPGGVSMKQVIECAEDEVEDVPVSALLSVERKNRYGSLPDLEDEELADPEELERLAVAEEWAPVLALPVKAGRGWVQPVVDESGGVDFGAFGTVDFERTAPEFDKARYKADRLQEKLGDLLIMVGIVKERLPGKAKYLVLKYLKMGVIDLDHIASDDMRALAMLWLRAKRLQSEIADLRESSRARWARHLEAFLEV